MERNAAFNDEAPAPPVIHWQCSGREGLRAEQQICALRCLEGQDCKLKVTMLVTS